MLDQHGTSHLLHEEDPCQLKEHLEQAILEKLQADVEQTVQQRHVCTESEAKKVTEYGIDVGATRRALRSKKLTGRMKHVIGQLAAGTYPIGRHLRELGL